MANPRRGERSPTQLDDARVIALINAFTRLGGRQVNITGGEPLAHPRLRELLESIDKRDTRTVLNTNALLADRFTRDGRVATLDAIFASLHTTDNRVFREQLGSRRNDDVERVERGILAFKRVGYEVQINYSLGPYNAAGFDGVLDFVLANALDLKVIALVRSSDEPGFYGGDWIEPGWLSKVLESRGATELAKSEGLGGHTTTYRIGISTVKIKNVARGRLRTDFCRGCLKAGQCGEGIYGLRVGVDGIMKPCLLRRDRFHPLRDDRDYESQVLETIGAMIGTWSHATFVSGAPA